MWSLNVPIVLTQNKIVKHKIAKSYDDIHNTFTFPCEKSKKVSFASFLNTQTNQLPFVTIALDLQDNSFALLLLNQHQALGVWLSLLLLKLN